MVWRRCNGGASSRLHAGLSGVVLHPGYQGFRLSDPIVFPLLEVAREFGAPIYAHTGTADTVSALEVTGNLWMESSRNGPANFQLFRLSGCHDRLVFGSSAPEYAPTVEVEVMLDSLGDDPLLEHVFAGAIRQICAGRLPA